MYYNFILISLTLIAKTTYTNAQRVYLGIPSAEIEQACREKTKVTAAQVTQWELESVNCVDRFEEVQEAACYHACILQKYGTRDENYDPVLDVIVKHIFYINPKQVERLVNECYKSFKGTDPCFRAYYLQKCIDKSIGKYPRGVKHVPIDLVPDDVVGRCRMRMGMTKEILCRFEHATDFDHCETTPLPRCYHQCILTELGYVQHGIYPNVRTYRNRYFYIGDVTFIRTLLDCWQSSYSVKNKGKCAVTYQMYKCMKLRFLEYPSQVLPPFNTIEE